MRDMKKGRDYSLGSTMCSINSFYYSHHFNHGIPMDRPGFPCIFVLIHCII